ncbi:MAG: protein kinase, partial [Pseudomonadales bacterium]|nr:protein kinase [Pseudomonadales bacterium]
ILVDRQNSAYVLDFGIAHFCENTQASKKKEEHQTQLGDVMGTAAYMAPEVLASADNASIQSDLYAFGILFYELLTGILPLGRFELPSTLNAAIPKVLDKVIESCLSPEESQRPRSANEIKTVLLKVIRGAHLAPEQKERAKKPSQRLRISFLC